MAVVTVVQRRPPEPPRALTGEEAVGSLEAGEGALFEALEVPRGAIARV
jgi:hypothetical protein